MSIKYHDNIHGQQYGEDHKLTNNWNPDADFADNEYIKVYFRIETPSYYNGEFHLSFDTDEERNAFYDEVTEVLNGIGWHESRKAMNGFCPEVSKNGAKLHCHPQNISGEILKKDVRVIAEALENHNTFYLRWVDVYDTVYDISNEEYQKYLETFGTEDAKGLILSYGKTTRANKFRYVSEISKAVADKIKLHRFRNENGYHGVDQQTVDFVKKIIKELVEAGYLIGIEDKETGEYEYIRTINKAEQKKRKLFIA